MIKLFLKLSAITLIFGVLCAAEPADPISNLKPGEWYEVPNSRLDAIAASPSQFPWLRGGIGGIVDCWAGGAFDTQRERLYLGPGGGHAGYNGNEIYAFDLHDLKWHRLNDPDPVLPGTEYTDVNKAPFAMHTYDGVQYLPPPFDRYVVMGGWGTQRTYALDPDHPDHWEIYPDHGTGRTGDISAYDPVSQLLWLSTPITAGKLSQWNPLTHVWTLRRNESPKPSYYETADVDYKRRMLVACGKGKLKTFRLTSIPELVEANEVDTTGDTDALNAPSPGFCYVPPIDKFVAWCNGADVYTLDLDAKKWTKNPPAATNKVVPGPAQQWGTFGRFRYVPSRNVFILYNSVKQNVFLYRMTADMPNVITSVEAKATKPNINTSISAAALSVIAKYADGSQKDVTADANYFALDPKQIEVDPKGRGTVKGLTPGAAKVRVVYCDPVFQRGFSSEVTLTVIDVLKESTIKELTLNSPKVTMVVGDSFQLEAVGSFTHGADEYHRNCTQEAVWSSAAADIIAVEHGLLHASKAGQKIAVHAAFNGKTADTEVNVVDAPKIWRIVFQVKAESPRVGWDADNGQAFNVQRGFGWLDTHDLSTRDDRASSHHQLLMRFVRAKGNKFKLMVPDGQYQVRIAMGDADYGAVPYSNWTALASEKLIYDQGHHNTISTKTVKADEGGLVFSVNGPINYLIVAPVGIDLNKYADDGPGEATKK